MLTTDAARLFNEISSLLEIKGESSFKVKAYQTAIRNLKKFEEPLADFKKRILNKEVKGFGAQLTSHIDELLDNGKIDLLEKLRQEIKPQTREFLKIKGLAGKKIRLINEELNITEISELKTACKDGSLEKVKGFAEKTLKSLYDSILFYEKHKGYFRISTHEQLLSKITLNCPFQICPISQSSWKDETFSKIFLLLKCTDVSKIRNWLDEINIEIIESKKQLLITKHKISDIQIEIELTTEKEFSSNKIKNTISEEHQDFLSTHGNISESLKTAKNETEFYEHFNLPLFPPELRSGGNEKSSLEHLAKFHPEHNKPGNDFSDKLISVDQIKGILHVHSDYSDGINSIKQLAEYTKEKGYKYLGISDHSRSASYAGGLSIDMIKKQHDEIDALNEDLYPFIILKGIESDILKNGDLDYPENILETFDFIIASVHSRFSLSKQEMTDRICNAIKNPYTNILAHPTGRLLLERPSYECDIEKIIQTASENNTSIELNSNPKRLDLSWKYLANAKKHGIMISINPDAHSISQIEYIKYGAMLSRKAGLFAEDVLNTYELKNNKLII